MRRIRVLANAAAVALVAASAACAASGTNVVDKPATGGTKDAGPLRDVLLVGNSVSGTVSVIDGRTFAPLGSVNVIPDLQRRLKEINSPFAFWRGFIYRRIKKAQLLEVGEPHEGDRFVDDLFLSPDGTKLYVSRSNLGDVAAFDLLAPGTPMIWRTTVAGRKADHATISADGSRIVVSASVVRKAQVLETTRGKVVGSFRTGLLPHQNDYSHDESRIYNGSLGRLSKPFAENAEKGARELTVVDAKTLKPIRTYRFDAGVRPTIITDEGRTMYVQLSYLNGVAKYDLRRDSPGEQAVLIKKLSQERTDASKKMYKNEDMFPHNSAHHGLAMSGDGTLLCDCATVEDRVWIVSTDNLTVRAIAEGIGSTPYWATTSADGNHCFVSMSGSDEIAVIDYKTAKLVSRVKVGDFPQRNRLGKMSEKAIAMLTR